MENTSTLAERLPWEQPWWRPAPGQWATFGYLISIHILSLIGLILYPIPSGSIFVVALSLLLLGGLGTSVCYHRALAHRTAKLNAVVEHILIFFTVFNGSGSPIQWTANHRHHHAQADTIDDVSSPRFGGFWWAHLRWLYQWPQSDPRRWSPDLMGNRYLVWSTLQPMLVGGSLFWGLLVFGWEGFFWIGPIRLMYALHMQCFVNSLLHLSPDAPEHTDSSRNIWWLGPLQLTAWGENWHRNHHQNPNSARFGWTTWQVDMGWYFLMLLEKFRLVKDVKRPRTLRPREKGAHSNARLERRRPRSSRHSTEGRVQNPTA